MEEIKNVNQVTMDEAVEVEVEEKRKNIFARMTDAVKSFGEKHPKIVKIGKGAGIATLAAGCYVLGKNAVTSNPVDPTYDDSEVDEDRIANEDSLEATEE